MGYHGRGRAGTMAAIAAICVVFCVLAMEKSNNLEKSLSFSQVRGRMAGGVKNGCGMRPRRVGVKGLLIPGQGGVDEDVVFTPFMKPLSREERTKYGQPDKILRNLRFQTAPWLERAEMIDVLLRSGVTLDTIIDEGGVTAMEQGNWRVALEVFKTLEELGASEDVLDFFRDEDNAQIAFELRNTPKEIRKEAAEYAVEMGFDDAQANALTRNINDYVRCNDRAKFGFEYTPADAMALKYYKQAAEEQDDNKYQDIVADARATGCSPTATAYFDEMDKMSVRERRQIILRFMSDTELFDQQLTVSVH
mmetsp:Transcript_6962/g.10622  ORF Transcript_6962/g.10622 Transcript_6962/m.10622 type:complete len:307 (+) Transcript_6962:32-952(+)